MTPDELVEALVEAPGGGEAHQVCRDYLAEGAAFEVSEALVPTRELVTIYQRRLEHAEAAGTGTLGMAEAVEALGTTTQAELRLGHVDREDAGWFFQLFLHPGRTEVVACLAVERA